MGFACKHGLTVEPATQAHAAQLAADIRPEDAAEMMASHGLGPMAGVRLAFRISQTTKAILDGGKVLAVFGVAHPEGEPTASGWLLATNAAKHFPIALVRALAREVPPLASSFGHLVNMVWAENKRALRLVRALGFEVLDPVPFGVSGLPFHPIVLRRA